MKKNGAFLFGLLFIGFWNFQAQAQEIFLGNKNIAPILYEEEGQPKGIVADIFNEVKKRIKTPIKLEASDWAEAQARARIGEVAGLVQLNETQERKAFLNFTGALLVSDFSIFRNSLNRKINSVADLKGKTVGVEAAGYPITIVGKLEGIEPVIIESWQDGFQRILNGQLDAIIVDRWVGEYVLAKYKITGITVVEKTVEETVSLIGVRKEKAQLLEEITVALNNMRDDGTMDAILKNWRDKHVVYVYADDYERIEIIKLLSLLLVFIVAVLILFAIRNKWLLSKIRTNNLLLDEKVAERTVELEKQRKRLSEIIWATNVGTWEWHIDKDHFIFNERWANIFGYRINEIHSFDKETWYRLVHPDDQDHFKTLLKKALSGDQDYFICECRIRHKDDYWVWVSERGKVVEWSEDKIAIRMAGTRSDISYRKAIENELREAQLSALKANEAKSNFLANMSHELRTPMMGIRGCLDLMLQNADIKEKAGDILDDLDTSSQTLMALLNDILDLSKIEAGKLILEPVECEPARVLNSLINLFENSAKQKGITLTSNAAQKFGDIYQLDELRLRQIVGNLINNAIKFTDDGEVNVHLQKIIQTDQDYLSISVEDTGIGIEQGKLETIFQRFEQAENHSARAYSGTGLGLSICRELVNLMGGEISVRSDYGKGSCFTLKIPVHKAIHKHQETSLKQLPTMKFLLAEDNEINRKIMQAMLTKNGHHVDIANNGYFATEKARVNVYDAILMDMHMPEMDGIEATRLIRATCPCNRETPIIAFTADVIDDHKTRFKKAGVDGVISKPVMYKELTDKLSIILERIEQKRTS